MYTHLLVPLEHSPYDRAILAHVSSLARLCGARITLIHVADGFAARTQQSLHLRESEEMRADREYLDAQVGVLQRDGLDADAVLAAGDPATEICAAADREQCDLIAMATHGHRFLADVVRGSVANQVRHRSMVPVLMVRGTAVPSGR
jgi:nucleotide-binding universal stress UspA family protein